MGDLVIDSKAIIINTVVHGGLKKKKKMFSIN